MGVGSWELGVGSLGEVAGGVPQRTRIFGCRSKNCELQKAKCELQNEKCLAVAAILQFSFSNLTFAIPSAVALGSGGSSENRLRQVRIEEWLRLIIPRPVVSLGSGQSQ